MLHYSYLKLVLVYVCTYDVDKYTSGAKDSDTPPGELYEDSTCLRQGYSNLSEVTCIWPTYKDSHDICKKEFYKSFHPSTWYSAER